MPATRLSWLQRSASIVTAALVLRLGVAVFLPPSDDFMYLMEPGWTAVRLAAGEGYSYDFYGVRPDTPLVAFLPPLHPWLIALALQFRHPALVYGMLQALLGTLTAWMVHRLGTGLAGRRVGALAGWGAAFYPAHLLLVGQPHSTVLHACCIAAVLLACWQIYLRPGVGWALLAGGMVGLSALNRPQMVLFAPIIVGWLWLNRVRGRRLWRPAAAVLLATVAVVVPWSVRNSVLLGRPVFLSTNGGVTFWNGNNPFTTGSAHDVYADKLAEYRGVERDAALPDVYQVPPPYPFPPDIEAQLETIPELELDNASYRAGLDFIRQQPGEWLRLEWRKLMSLWWFRPNLGANPIYRPHWILPYRIQYAILLVLVVAGVVISLRRWRRYSLLFVLLAFYTIVHLVYNVLTRYRWEIELLMLIFAALSLEAAWLKIKTWRAAG